MWLAAIFLHLNDNKTEVILVNLDNKPISCPSEFSSLALSHKSSAVNLAVKIDSQLKMDAQIKPFFFLLRLFSKLISIISKHELETIIHPFVTLWLVYCEACLYGAKLFLHHLQLVLNVTARSLTGLYRWQPIFPVLKFLYWLPFDFLISFKILLFVSRSLHGPAPPRLAELLSPHHLVITEVSRPSSTVCFGRAFSCCAMLRPSKSSWPSPLQLLKLVKKHSFSPLIWLWVPLIMSFYSDYFLLPLFHLPDYFWLYC